MPISQSDQIYALTELIRHPYAFDPGSLEYLVEESLRVPEGAVRTVCSLLEINTLSPIELENVEHFIRRAATQRPIQRALEKCAKKKGRCPKAKQPWLRRVLSRGVSRVRTQRPDRPARHVDVVAPRAAAGSTAIDSLASLDLRDFSGKIDEFPRLLDRLGEISEGVGRVEIRLGGA